MKRQEKQTWSPAGDREKRPGDRIIKTNQRVQRLAQALQKSRANPSYLEFFGLCRPPFDRLPGLAGVFDTEQYTLLLDHLGQTTVQSDFLIAICGADGCGKTTLLNRFLFSLGDDVCVARLDESYKGVRNFYCEILRQLGFNDIDGKPEELRRITREFIVNRGMASEPVLLVIDNAHLISPFILEQLRWMSAIKVDEVRVLSCVLAGNSDLIRIMDSAAMSQFAFSNYIRFHIRAYSESETMKYVWGRLNFAGCSDRLTIADEAQPLIHRFSGGIPRLINILCDSLLREACSRDSTEITDEMLRNVAENRHLIPHVRPYTGRGRRRSDPDFDSSYSEIDSDCSIPTPPGQDDFSVGDRSQGNANTTDGEHSRNAGDSTGLLQQVSRMSKKLAELKGENSRYLKQIDLQDTDIHKLEEALQSQSLRYTELEEAFGNQSGAYEQLSESMSQRLRYLERSEETNRLLVETLRQNQQEIVDFRQQHDTDGEEIARLRSDLSDALEALDCYQLELDAAKLAAGELQILADSQERKILQNAAEISDLEAIVEEHDQEVFILQSRIGDLESEQLAVADRLDHFASLEAYAHDCEMQLREQQSSSDDAQQHDALLIADSDTISPARSADKDSGDPEPGRVPIRTIEVFRGDVQEQVLRLSDDQKRIMIGRDSDNELVLDSSFISRHHAIVSFREDGSACIEDLNSLNGIVVNKTKLPSAELVVGDVIILGDFCLLPGPA